MKILLLSILLSNTSCEFLREHPNTKDMLPDVVENLNNKFLRIRKFIIPNAGQYFEGTAKEFAEAMAHGNYSKMAEMLKNKQVDINHVGKEGVSFIIFAYRIKSKEALRQLIKLGANVNLISVRPSPNYKILKEVGNNDNLLYVQTYLLLEMTDEREKDLEWIEIAMKAGGNPCIEVPNRFSAIMEAAHGYDDYKTFKTYKRLVELEASPNCKKDSLDYDSPLFTIALDGRWDLVYWSYKHGANLSDYVISEKQIYNKNMNKYEYPKYKYYLKDDIQNDNTGPNEFYIKEYNALAYRKAVKDILRSKGFKFPELEEWEIRLGHKESYEKTVEKITE